MLDQEEIDQRKAQVAAWYSSESFKAQLFEQKFKVHLENLIRIEHLDAKLETRTKASESLEKKALTLSTTGDFKYVDPTLEITDLVGARLMVPLSTDIKRVADVIRGSFRIIEEADRGEGDADGSIPGYRSLHFLVQMNETARQSAEFAAFGDFTAEIQVRTILQHAWASLQHDLMYKSTRSPAPQIRRRLIALAGLLELADREFIEVRNAHLEGGGLTSAHVSATPAGKLTASSLRAFVEGFFEQEDPAPHVWFAELHTITGDLGLASVEELQALVAPLHPRAIGIRDVVQATRPWVNTAFIFDLVLRAAVGDRYLTARAAASNTEVTADIAEAFRHEIAALEEVLTQ